LEDLNDFALAGHIEGIFDHPVRPGDAQSAAGSQLLISR
jgi:hypothetical protein